MIKIAGSVRQVQAALIKLLRDDATLQSYLGSKPTRVYPPGITESAVMPRVTVSNPTSSDTLAGLGITAAFPVWKNLFCRIDVWDKDPKMVDKVTERIEDVIGSNRNYKPSTVVINNQSGQAQSTAASGYFFNVKIAGGTPCTVAVPKQLYQRTILLTGRWLQTA